MTWRFFVLIGVMVSLPFSPAQGQAAGTAAQISRPPVVGEPFSDAVNVSVSKLVAKTPESLSILFSLTNQSPFFKSVIYSVYFQPKSENQTPFTHIIREDVQLPPLGIVPVETTLPTPNFLSGDYEIFIRVESPAGALLAQGHALPINLTASATVSLEKCFTLDQQAIGTGETLRLDAAGEFPEITCLLTSTSDDPHPQTYQISSHLNNGSLTGREVHRTTSEIVLTGQEKKTVAFEGVSGKLKAGLSVHSLEVRDASARLITPPVVTTLFVGGNMAKVLASKPDMTAYPVGTAAQVKLNVQAFGPDQKNFRFQVKLSDLEGECGASALTAWEGNSVPMISVPLYKSCQDYSVRVSVSNQDGQELDSFVESFLTKKRAAVLETPQSPLPKPSELLLLILTSLGILGLVWYVVARAKKSGHMLIFGFLLVTPLFFSLTPPALASGDWVETWDLWNKPNPGCAYSVGDQLIPRDKVFGGGDLSFDKAEYSPGETVTVTASVSWMIWGNPGEDRGNINATFDVPGAWIGSSISHLNVTGIVTDSHTYTFPAPATPGIYPARYTTQHVVPTSLTYSHPQCTDGWEHTGPNNLSGASFRVVAAPAVCGNGIVEGIEQCDQGITNGLCPAVCSQTCSTNTCSPSNCGNELLSWNVSGVTCSAWSGITGTGLLTTPDPLVSTNGNTGTARFSCKADGTGYTGPAASPAPTCTGPGINNLIVCPSHPLIFSGGTIQLHAYYDSVPQSCVAGGHLGVDVTSASAWSSNQTSVATVNNTSNKGLVTGANVTAQSTANIKATYLGLSGISAVTVNPNCAYTCDAVIQANTCINDPGYQIQDTCGVMHICSGTRICDLNYREIAP